MKRRFILTSLGLAAITAYALVKSQNTFPLSSEIVPAESNPAMKQEQPFNDLDLNYEPLAAQPRSHPSSNSISLRK